METKRIYVTLDTLTIDKLEKIREQLAEDNLGRITNSDVVKYLISSFENNNNNEKQKTV